MSYLQILRHAIFILSILTLVGCKNYSLFGTYSQYSTFISSVTLYPDSTFEAGTSSCMTSSNLKGKWSYKNGYLHLQPTIPEDMYYDTLSKSYVYKDVFNESKKIEGMAVKRYYADFSSKIFKVKRNKLYEQYTDTLHNLNYSCPFIKIPRDTTAYRKIKRLKRKNELDCSDLSKRQKFLLRLKIIK